MASKELLALWALIETDLNRAASLIPSCDGNDPCLNWFRDNLEHNELELACDGLEEYGNAHPVDSGFWRALRDAAEKMNQRDRAARYEAMANAKI